MREQDKTITRDEVRKIIEESAKKLDPKIYNFEKRHRVVEELEKLIKTQTPEADWTTCPITEILVEHGLKDPNKFIKATSAHALTTIPDKKVVLKLLPNLAKLLNTKKHDLLLFMIELLSNVGHKDVLQYLAPLQKHEDPRVRWCLAFQLPKINDEDVAEHLANLLEDEDPKVKEIAANRIYVFGNAILNESVINPYAEALIKIMPYLRHGDHPDVIKKALDYVRKRKKISDIKKYINKLRNDQNIKPVETPSTQTKITIPRLKFPKFPKKV